MSLIIVHRLGTIGRISDSVYRRFVIKCKLSENVYHRLIIICMLSVII